MIRKTVIFIGLALACVSGVRADFNPVALTPSSYTFDIVVEKSTPAALQYFITASQGAGTNRSDATWFEQGLWRSPHETVGFPPAGTVFTHQSSNTIQFVMPPTYLTNNGLIVDTTVPEGGTLSFVTPKTCSKLSILGSSGGGNALANYTVTHADASVESGTVYYDDWFDGPNPAFVAHGRVGTPAGGEQDNGNNPRLYSAEIDVSSASPVVSVSFTYNTGGHIGIFAISASTDGTTYTPVPIQGFNHRVIMPAAFPLTATMDQGVNTADNGNLATWFEAGYIPDQPTYGLPPSGSTFSSQSQPTHRFQMADYTKNNGILIDSNHTTANITPASPAAYSAFALLTAGGNIGSGSRMTNLCIMQHANGLKETNTFYGYDWFEGSVPGFVAYAANGRVNMHARTVNSLGSGNPKLFETYFALQDTDSPVTNILLQYGSARNANATTFIMAVSASSGGIPPVILSQPSRLNTWPGNTARFSTTMGAGTPPFYYMWQRAASPDGPYVTLNDGGNISGSASSNLTVANVSAADAGYYQVIVSNAVGFTTSTPPATLYLLNSTLGNITLPTDVISDTAFANNPAPNGGEDVTRIIDRMTSKYLTFGTDGDPAAPYTGPSGFVITPGVGNTVVSGLRVYAANDAPDRDPAEITLEGSNDNGANWTTVLPQTALSLPDSRNPGGQRINITNHVLQEITFANTTGYTSYRVTFSNVKSNSTAIGMQVAEVELLGLASGPPVVVMPYSLAADDMAVLGNTAILRVNTAGTQPITYQWTHNGTPLLNDSHISGSTSNVLIISNVQAGDAGYYQLNMTNSAGFYNMYPGGGASQNLGVTATAGFFTNGVGWTMNSSPAALGSILENNVLTLTSDQGSSARSAFYNTPLPIDAFQASFVYQRVSGGADGAAFVLQNDPRGPAALGGAGGSLGLSGISPSAALTMSIYSGANNVPGISFGLNGANGAPYQSTAPASLTNGNPIAVNIAYASGIANVTLKDTITGDTFTTTLPIGNLPAILGANTAYVGFTGADGGVTSTQTISDFTFVPLAKLSVQLAGSSIVLAWPASATGYELQSQPGLPGSNWQKVNATVIQENGMNKVTLPLGTGNQFFRLAKPATP